MNVIAFIIGIILLLGVGIPVSQEVIAISESSILNIFEANIPTSQESQLQSFPSCQSLCCLSESFTQDSWPSEHWLQLQGQEVCRSNLTPGPGFGPLCPIGTT